MRSHLLEILGFGGGIVSFLIQFKPVLSGLFLLLSCASLLCGLVWNYKRNKREKELHNETIKKIKGVL